MQTFGEYLESFSWWQDMIVPWVLQPHKIPVFLAGAALGSAIGTGAGAWRALTRLKPSEIPKGTARWGIGMLTNWKYTPKWAENTNVEFPADLQHEADELVELGQQLNAARNNPEEFQRLKSLMIKKSKQFYDKIQTMSGKRKQSLASSLPLDMI